MKETDEDGIEADLTERIQPDRMAKPAPGGLQEKEGGEGEEEEEGGGRGRKRKTTPEDDEMEGSDFETDMKEEKEKEAREAAKDAKPVKKTAPKGKKK